MGKLLVWVVLGFVILLLVRLLGPAKRRPREPHGGGESAGGASGEGDRAKDERAKDERDPPRELMMRCAVCSVHVPSSEAVFAGGKVYCSAAHRDAARGA
ncbi:MAG: PP0621 family protein [Lautropia sp.]